MSTLKKYVEKHGSFETKRISSREAFEFYKDQPTVQINAFSRGTDLPDFYTLEVKDISVLDRLGEKSAIKILKNLVYLAFN